MIAHRLGLIPLISRNVSKGLRYTRDCDCDEGCYYCMVTLRLKVTFSGNDGEQFMRVTSDMLEVVPSPGGVRFFSCSSPIVRRCPFSLPLLILLNSTLSRRLLILMDLRLNFQRKIVSSSTIVILKWASLAEREIPLYLRY